MRHPAKFLPTVFNKKSSCWSKNLCGAW